MPLRAQSETRSADAVGSDIAARISRRDDEPLPLKLMRPLIGRGRVTGVLAIGGGIMVGATLFMTASPVYESQGSMRILPSKPTILYDDPESNPATLFGAFVESQGEVITSRPVLERAVELAKAGEEACRFDGLTARDLAERIEVEHPENSQSMYVRCRDADGRRAKTTVDLVMRSYMAAYEALLVERRDVRLRVLNERRTSLEEQCAALRGLLRECEAADDTAQLDRLHTAKARFLEGLTRQIADLEGDYAVAEPMAAEEAKPAAGPPSDLAMDEIAQVDPVMGQYLAVLREAESRAAELGARLGETHPQMARARQVVQTCEDDAKRYAARFRELHGRQARLQIRREQTPWRSRARQMGMRLAQLRRLHDAGHRDLQAIRERIADAIRKRHEGAHLRQQLAMHEDMLRKTRVRMDQLTLESGYGTRVELVNPGEVPQRPVRNARNSRAMIGGLAGCVLGLLLAFGIASLDRRCLAASAVTASWRIPCLGVLPWIEVTHDGRRGSPGGEEVDLAPMEPVLYRIHRIRAALEQGGVEQERGQVIGLVSPRAGGGCTSLSLALGMSFSSCRRPNLLVDLDLAERDLTRRTDIWRRSDGRDTSHDDDLFHLLDGQRPERAVTETPIVGTDVVRCGQGRVTDMIHLSQTELQRVVSEARSLYDHVLLDPGPIAREGQMSLVRPFVDKVLVVVARGMKQDEIDLLLGDLAEHEVAVAGFVFVEGMDPGTSAAARGRGRCGGRQRQACAQPAALQALGPLAFTMARSVQSQQAGSVARRKAA